MYGRSVAGAVVGGAVIAVIGLVAGGAFGVLVATTAGRESTGGFLDLRPALPLLLALLGGGLGWFAGAPIGAWWALERGGHPLPGETGLLLGVADALAVVMWIGWLGRWSDGAGWDRAVPVVLATHGLFPLAARALAVAVSDYS